VTRFKDQEIEKYDEKFKNETNKTVEDFINNNDNVDEIKSVNIKNLNKILKKLKNKLSCGEDKITNIMLKIKNISEKF
jgi:seryl-tRNA synthetase